MNLRERRERLGMTQAAMASYLGICEATMRAREKRGYPNKAEHLALLCLEQRCGLDTEAKEGSDRHG